APLLRHENVARLEIAMNDEAAMRVRDDLAHLPEQLQPPFEAEPLRVAVLGERGAFNIFHDHVGPAIARDAAIEEPRDARMLEPREDVALGVKARGLRNGAVLQEFQRRALPERAIRADRGIYLACAPTIDQMLDLPHAEPRARRQRAR